MFALIGLVCIGILVVGWYLQYGPARQQPCPLCVLQRFTYLALAAVCLLAWAHAPQRAGLLIYAVIAELMAATGAGLAFWHVTKGPSMTSCLDDPVGEFVNGLPTANWWPEYFFANGGCADQYPAILGLHVPQWSLVLFIALIAMCTAAIVAALRQKRAA